MLHTNRKAEIQILSSGSMLAHSQADQALDHIFGDDMGIGRGAGDDTNGPNVGGGLVEYIVQKMM
jgi:hypothetical protein